MVLVQRSMHVLRLRVRCVRMRAVVAWMCLLAFVIASQGLMPSAALLTRIGVLPASAERYPCEGCACGCGSAEHCWTSCCCHTLEERVDWAIANNVAIPRSIAPRAFALVMARAAAAELPACCAARAMQAHDDSHADADGACHGDCHAAPGASSSADRTLAVRTATLSALGCKGISGWLAVAPPMLPHAFVALTLPRAIRPSFDAPISDALPAGLVIEHPAPPPRA